MKTKDISALIEHVHDDLIAGYERRHPEVGSLKEKATQLDLLQEGKKFWYFLGFGFLLLNIFVLTVVIAPKCKQLSPILLVIMGCVVVAISSFAILRSMKFSDQFAVVSGQLEEFRQKVEVLYSSQDDKNWLCNVAFVEMVLVGLANAVLRAEAEFLKKRLNIAISEEAVIRTARNVLTARAAFNAALRVAKDDLDLPIEQRALFAQAQKSIDS